MNNVNIYAIPLNTIYNFNSFLKNKLDILPTDAYEIVDYLQNRFVWEHNGCQYQGIIPKFEKNISKNNGERDIEKIPINAVIEFYDFMQDNFMLSTDKAFDVIYYLQEKFFWEDGQGSHKGILPDYYEKCRHHSKCDILFDMNSEGGCIEDDNTGPLCDYHYSLEYYRKHSDS
ncbi:MAG: hypothetical protein ACOCRX_11770 [Candidatus Woesearchaeota archaeon]